MALRPKLEFYRFKLISKDDKNKTFRDFALEELYQRKPNLDIQIMNKLFDYFMNTLSSEVAKNKRIKKQLKVIKNQANKYLKHIPKVDVQNNTIYGVINGGRFGRNGMMSDSAVEVEEANAFGPDKTILRYYYFLLYLPLDHNEGCFIIHSNSKEETITDLFKEYISNLFKKGNFKKMEIFNFCPKTLLNEYKNKAIIKSLEFRETYLGSLYTDENLLVRDQLYDVKIEIIPKGNKIRLEDVSLFKKLAQELNFLNIKQTPDKLSDFRKKKITVKNTKSNMDRTFEFNDDEFNLTPVVYLDEHIEKYNNDDTPDFDELNKYCQSLFHEEILPELRPDLFLIEDER